MNRPILNIYIIRGINTGETGPSQEFFYGGQGGTHTIINTDENTSKISTAKVMRDLFY